MKGFTYMTVLFIVAIIATGLALTGEVWQTSTMREREAELLFVGNQYRRAIQGYYLNGPQRQYPRSLEDLLKDPRQPGTVRYLRRIYPDPITEKNFVLVKAPDGGILGVQSESEAAPIKQANFKLRDRTFEGAQKYSDWKFIFQPAAAKPGATVKPGAPSTAGKPAAQPLGR